MLKKKIIYEIDKRCPICYTNNKTIWKYPKCCVVVKKESKKCNAICFSCYEIMENDASQKATEKLKYFENEYSILKHLKKISNDKKTDYHFTRLKNILEINDSDINCQTDKKIIDFYKNILVKKIGNIKQCVSNKKLQIRCPFCNDSETYTLWSKKIKKNIKYIEIDEDEEVKKHKYIPPLPTLLPKMNGRDN